MAADEHVDDYDRHVEHGARVLAERAMDASDEFGGYESAVVTLAPDVLLEETSWFDGDRGAAFYGAVLDRSSRLDVVPSEWGYLARDVDTPGDVVAMLAFYAFEADTVEQALLLGA